MPNSSRRRLHRGFIAAATAVLFSACGRNFATLHENGRRHYVEANYVEAVDALNAALPRWDESDGMESKAQTYQLLGLSYHKLRKTDQALDAYQNAVKLSTNAYESAYNMGRIYLTSSRSREAAKAFREALRMKEDDPMALLGLANSVFALGHSGEAEVYYRRILEVSPGVKEAMENLRQIEKRRAPPAAPSQKTNSKRQPSLRRRR